MKTWRYEKETKTIRSVPENYWIASMDSTDGAVNSETNGRIIAKVPEMIKMLKLAHIYVEDKRMSGLLASFINNLGREYPVSKSYWIVFFGKEIGQGGRTYMIEKTVYSDTEEKAIAELNKTYMNISIISVTNGVGNGKQS